MVDADNDERWYLAGSHCLSGSLSRAPGLPAQRQRRFKQVLAVVQVQHWVAPERGATVLVACNPVAV